MPNKTTPANKLQHEIIATISSKPIIPILVYASICSQVERLKGNPSGIVVTHDDP